MSAIRPLCNGDTDDDDDNNLRYLEIHLAIFQPIKTPESFMSQQKALMNII